MKDWQQISIETKVQKHRAAFNLRQACSGVNRRSRVPRRTKSQPCPEGRYFRNRLVADFEIAARAFGPAARCSGFRHPSPMLNLSMKHSATMRSRLVGFDRSSNTVPGRPGGTGRSCPVPSGRRASGERPAHPPGRKIYPPPCRGCLQLAHGLFADDWTQPQRTGNYRLASVEARGVQLTGFNHYPNCGCGWCVNYGGRSSGADRARMVDGLRERDAFNS